MIISNHHAFSQKNILSTFVDRVSHHSSFEDAWKEGLRFSTMRCYPYPD